jgi:hypothetical protein
MLRRGAVQLRREHNVLGDALTLPGAILVREKNGTLTHIQTWPKPCTQGLMNLVKRISPLPGFVKVARQMRTSSFDLRLPLVGVCSVARHTHQLLLKRE